MATQYRQLECVLDAASALHPSERPHWARAPRIAHAAQASEYAQAQARARHTNACSTETRASMRVRSDRNGVRKHARVHAHEQSSVTGTHATASVLARCKCARAHVCVRADVCDRQCIHVPLRPRTSPNPPSCACVCACGFSYKHALVLAIEQHCYRIVLLLAMLLTTPRPPVHKPHPSSLSCGSRPSLYHARLHSILCTASQSCSRFLNRAYQILNSSEAVFVKARERVFSLQRVQQTLIGRAVQADGSLCDNEADAEQLRKRQRSESHTNVPSAREDSASTINASIKFNTGTSTSGGSNFLLPNSESPFPAPARAQLQLSSCNTLPREAASVTGVRAKEATALAVRWNLEEFPKWHALLHLLEDIGIQTQTHVP
eukprot:1255240-Pleurochrysis_carterae.AAC.1